jgi:hypothetical protein
MHMHCQANGMSAWGRCSDSRLSMAACGLITCQNGMQAGTLQGLVRVRQLMLPCCWTITFITSISFVLAMKSHMSMMEKQAIR